MTTQSPNVPPPSAPMPPSPVYPPPPTSYGTRPPAYGGPPPSAPPPYGSTPGGARPPAGRRTALWVAVALIAAGALALVGVIVAGRSDDTASPATTASPTVDPGTTTPVTAVPTTPTTPAADLQGPVDVLSSFTFTEVLAITWDGGQFTMDVSGTYANSGDQQCTATAHYEGVEFTMSATVLGDRAWFDDGVSGPKAVAVDDADLESFLRGCPSSHLMWGESFSQAPAGGVAGTIDGMNVITYDVTDSSVEWDTMFGLPPGFDAQAMKVWTSADRTWVAGAEMVVTSSAETFRDWMGMPPPGVTGDATMMMAIHVMNPNDPSLVVTAPL